MENTEFFGIDASREYLDVPVYPTEYTDRVANTLSGVTELLDRF